MHSHAPKGGSEMLATVNVSYDDEFRRPSRHPPFQMFNFCVHRRRGGGPAVAAAEAIAAEAPAAAAAAAKIVTNERKSVICGS